MRYWEETRLGESPWATISRSRSTYTSSFPETSRTGDTETYSSTRSHSGSTQYESLGMYGSSSESGSWSESYSRTGEYGGTGVGGVKWSESSSSSASYSSSVSWDYVGVTTYSASSSSSTRGYSQTETYATLNSTGGTTTPSRSSFTDTGKKSATATTTSAAWDQPTETCRASTIISGLEAVRVVTTEATFTKWFPVSTTATRSENTMSGTSAGTTEITYTTTGSTSSESTSIYTEYSTFYDGTGFNTTFGSYYVRGQHTVAAYEAEPDHYLAHCTKGAGQGAFSDVFATYRSTIFESAPSFEVVSDMGSTLAGYQFWTVTKDPFTKEVTVLIETTIYRTLGDGTPNGTQTIAGNGYTTIYDESGSTAYAFGGVVGYSTATSELWVAGEMTTTNHSASVIYRATRAGTYSTLRSRTLGVTVTGLNSSGGSVEYQVTSTLDYLGHGTAGEDYLTYVESVVCGASATVYYFGAHSAVSMLQASRTPSLNRIDRIVGYQSPHSLGPDGPMGTGITANEDFLRCPNLALGAQELSVHFVGNVSTVSSSDTRETQSMDSAGFSISRAVGATTHYTDSSLSEITYNSSATYTTFTASVGLAGVGDRFGNGNHAGSPSLYIPGLTTVYWGYEVYTVAVNRESGSPVPVIIGGAHARTGGEQVAHGFVNIAYTTMGSDGSPVSSTSSGSFLNSLGSGCMAFEMVECNDYSVIPFQYGGRPVPIEFAD